MAAPGGGKALPAEEHLERLKEVVAKHRDDLRKLEQAICAGTSGGGFLDEGGSDVWDPYSDAVAISLQPSEDCSVADLLVSDNKELSKIVQALTSVADNCAFLAQQARDEFFAPLSAFGEQFDDDRMEEGAEVQRITALLPFLERLAIFGTQCHAVVANGMAQLAGLYTDEPGSRYRETFKGAHPHFLLLQLADLLAALVTLDLLIETNEELRAQWGEYKRMLEGAALEPEVFGMNPNRIAKILMAVTRMEADVLDGALLRGCWMQDIAWHHAKGVSEARSNKTLSDEVLAWVKGHLAYLTSHIGDATESTHRHQVVGCLAVWVLVAQMKRGMEIDVKAIHKAVIGIKAKVPAVVLHGRALFVISDFLNKNLPSLLGKPTKEEPLSKVVAPLADKFPSQIQALELQLSAWMVRMESDFSSKVAIGEMLSTRANLLVQGVLLANQVGHLLRLLLAMHLHTRVPIRKSSLPLLLQAVRMLKAIQHTYFRKSPLIAAQVASLR
ncbi:WASH complex subunit 7 [Baffinella frigidus]|nr:WASH complex subunit 7 [Cryptophyta sp. CCMP2293]